MVQKYLNNNERILHQTGSIIIDDESGFVGYVTTQRLIFLKRTGMLFKKDRLIDMFLKHINGVNVTEKGLIFKNKCLTIRGPNNTIYVHGNAKDLDSFYKKLNEQIPNI